MDPLYKQIDDLRAERDDLKAALRELVDATKKREDTRSAYYADQNDKNAADLLLAARTWRAKLTAAERLLNKETVDAETS